MPKPRKSASKKKPKRRTNIPRPHNGGEWTEARKKSFITSALRRASWPPRHAAVKKAFVGKGENPATGRMCKLHRCEKCGELFPQNGVQADHITPCIGPEGFVDWNTFIERLFVEAEHYQILCKEKCHKEVTTQERLERDEAARAREAAMVDPQAALAGLVYPD